MTLVFQVIMSSLIYENKPKYLVYDEFKIEIQAVQQLSSISKYDFGNFTFNNSIEISNVTQMLNYIDVNRMNLSFDQDNNFVMNGLNGTIKLVYSFVYKIVGPSGVSSVGTFAIESVDYSIFKNYSVNNTKLTTNAGILKLTFELGDVVSKSNVESYLLELIKLALKSMLDTNVYNIVTAYNNDLQNYYSNKEQNKTYLNFNTVNPNLNYTIDFTQDRVPLIYDSENIIYYHSGKVNELNMTHAEPSNITKDKYQIIINEKVINLFINDFVSSGLLDYTITNKNLPPNNPYNLLIQSFGQIIPDLYNLYPRNDEIILWNKITDANYLNGKFTIYSEIYHHKTMRKLCMFKTNYIFKLNSSLNDMKLNFYIDNKSVDIQSIEVSKASPSYSKVNLSTLKKWMESSLKSYLYQSNYVFIQNSINLSNIFDNVTEVIKEENQLKIFGAPRSFRLEKTKVIKNNLKFLN
jgi:hypothetical protein